MKTIGIVVSQYLGVNGHGAESHTVLSFCKIFGSQYKTILIGGEIVPKELEVYHEIPFIRYMCLPKYLRIFLHLPVCFINTFLFCKKNKVDFLINGGGVWYAGFSILIVSKILKIRYVIRTAEDHFCYWRYVQSKKYKIFHYIITNLLSKYVLKNADHILTVGFNSRDYFINKLKRNINNTHYSVGPINRHRFTAYETKNIRKSLCWNNGERIILYVGAISGVKGTHLFPSIISRVLSKCENTKFLIIGNETEPGNRISSNIIAAGGNNVKIIPPVKHNELHNYYKSCDVLIFLCQVGVGYGHVNIEASLCNLPVLSLNPGLDVEWFLKDACNDTPNQIADRIVEKNYKVAELPKEFESEYITKNHLKLANRLV